MTECGSGSVLPAMPSSDLMHVPAPLGRLSPLCKLLLLTCMVGCVEGVCPHCYGWLQSYGSHRLDALAHEGRWTAPAAHLVCAVGVLWARGTPPPTGEVGVGRGVEARPRPTSGVARRSARPEIMGN